MLYVDDGLIVAKYAEDIDLLLTKLQNEFQLSKAEPTSYLGCEVVCDEGGIFLRQSGYIKKMMNRFNVTRRLSIPAVKTEFENGDKTELHESEIHNFQSITGSLQYLACGTRPDIAYATNRASQENAKPQQM